MSIMATCGHDVGNGLDYLVEEYARERDGTPCTSTLNLCKKCYKKHKRWRLIKRVINITDWGDE